MDSNPPFDWNTTANSLQRIAAVDALEAATIDHFLRRLVGYRRAVERSNKRAADLMAKIASGSANEADVLNTDDRVLDSEINELRTAAKEAAAVYQKRGINSAPIAQLIPGVGLASDDKHFAAVIASIISLADAYDEKQNSGAMPRTVGGKYKLGPGRTVTRNGMADLSKQEFNIFMAIKERDSVPLGELMRPAHDDAIWKERFDQDDDKKVQKIQKAISRLNNKLTVGNVTISIDVSGADLLITYR